MDGSQELTDIQRFYQNSTVFLTGATGFIGKLVCEKILRALPIKKIFILVRSKKEKPAIKRFEEIFESPAFDLVKRNNPNILDKVFIMNGDCTLPMLGLSEDDQKTFIDEVDVIFHVAATVRFDEKIKTATITNVRATKDLISLAKQIKKLKTFVYTGTGFSNCLLQEIKEEVYPSKISAEKLIAACESLDDECLESMTKTLIGEWPNTYTFTKQVTEDYINRETRDIPICITRPAIVVSTMSEPCTAFVDNIFTLAGFVVANGAGFNRVTYYKNTVLDIVPADIVVNECIAAGWYTGTTFKPDKKRTVVINISTARDNPIHQDEIYDLCDHYSRSVPSIKLPAYPFAFRTSCKYNYLFLRLFLHTMFAHIVDLGIRLQGNKPMYVKAVQKLHKFQQSYEYFTTHYLNLHVENTHLMLKKMSFTDRQLFNFDVTTINWQNYFSQYTKGLRFYLLKDTMDTLPEGKKKYNYYKKVFFATWAVFLIVLYAIGKFLIFRVIPFTVSVILYLLRGVVC